MVVAVAGVAGSGKTTLGRALGERLGWPVIDLDAVTNPLLDALPAEALGGHWLSSPHAERIRVGRYAALRAVVRETLRTVEGVIVVAPFTRELGGGPEWTDLVSGWDGAEVVMVRIRADRDLLASRRSTRGETRDAHRVDAGEGAPSPVAALTVDADLGTAQQLDRVLPLVQRSDLDTGAAVFDADFDAVLFDLDGTLVDSTASVIRSWRRLTEEYGAPLHVLHENHGQPARTLISRLLPADRHAEGLARITELEVADAVDLPTVRGAADFYDSVPGRRRAIVTSGSVPIALARLAAAGLAPPDVFVTVDDVSRGKPDPEPFLLAAARLGVDPARCLVVEDAPAGVAAARAAGCAVLALTGTVPVDELHGADLVADGLDRVRIALTAAGALRLEPAA